MLKAGHVKHHKDCGFGKKVRQLQTNKDLILMTDFNDINNFTIGILGYIKFKNLLFKTVSLSGYKFQ